MDRQRERCFPLGPPCLLVSFRSGLSTQTHASCPRVAWAFAAQLRGYELLGKYLGMWTERVDVSSDEKLIAALIAGRRRAQGLPPVCDAEEEITEPVIIEEPDTKAKPN